MNQSTCLAVVAASAVGEVFTELDHRVAEVVQRIRGLVGSFFGDRPIARRNPGFRAGLGSARARTRPQDRRSLIQCPRTR